MNTMKIIPPSNHKPNTHPPQNHPFPKNPTIPFLLFPPFTSAIPIVLPPPNSLCAHAVLVLLIIVLLTPATACVTCLAAFKSRSVPVVWAFVDGGSDILFLGPRTVPLLLLLLLLLVVVVVG